MYTTVYCVSTSTVCDARTLTSLPTLGLGLGLGLGLFFTCRLGHAHRSANAHYLGHAQISTPTLGLGLELGLAVT